jgi:hypothetical protein
MTTPLQRDRRVRRGALPLVAAVGTAMLGTAMLGTATFAPDASAQSIGFSLAPAAQRIEWNDALPLSED